MTSYVTTYHVQIEATDVDQARSIADFLAEMLASEGCDPIRVAGVQQATLDTEGAPVDFDELPPDVGRSLTIEVDGVVYVFGAGELE